MNGMSNLPQIYQDFMRSQFVNAINQQTNGGGGGNTGGLLTTTTPASGHVPSSTAFPNLDFAKQLSSMSPQQQAQFAQQQMAAAVAAVQAHVQKQQQNNYVNQMQAQMNAVAAAAAAQQQQLIRQQQQQQQQSIVPNGANNNNFPYGPKSFFMPSNLDQIKSTINSFYQNTTQGLNHPQSSPSMNSAFTNQHREQKMSKENLLLHQQDMLQQQIEQASRRHNQAARIEKNRLLNEQQNQNRGRGRPKRYQNEAFSAFKRSPSRTPSPNNENSPVSNKSRSCSPREFKYLKKSHVQQSSTHDQSSTARSSFNTSSDNVNGTSVTRTSTPSKLEYAPNPDESVLNVKIEDGCEETRNSDISHYKEEELLDDVHNDVYSSMYEGDNDMLDEQDDTGLIPEELNEDDEYLSKDNEELNTTSSTSKTSSSNAKQNMKKIISQKNTALSTSTTNVNNQQQNNPAAGPAYDFSMQALEMSLYGYLRQTDPMFASHAMSGLRVPPYFKSLSQSQQSGANSGLEHLKLLQSDILKKETASSFSSSSNSSNSSIAASKNEPAKSTSNGNKKSNFSIENLLTASSSSATSSPSSSSSSSVSQLTQQPFSTLMNQHFSLAQQQQHHQQQQQQMHLQMQYQSMQSPIDTEKLDLPDELQIRQSFQTELTHHGVFCKKTVITKGTRFGPFPGKPVLPADIKSTEDNNHMWEIFNDGRLSHFIDGRSQSGSSPSAGQKSTLSPVSSSASSSASTGNNNTNSTNQWMIYVNCARFAQEQNMIAVQLEGDIFYEVCKDIAQGQELLVWYGDSYLQFLGIPVSLKDMTDEISEDTTENKDGYACDRCGKVFAYKYYRDKHLKYTRCVDQGDRKFPCHLCTRSFEKRDRLRIHILHVHEKHRPHKCSVCGKSFSQSSSLNKHMRVHSGERPYKCVYCNKAFTASSILRTHIRQHSGEKPFKCKYCGKAFASHAAHDSHVRRTHNISKDKEANFIL